MQTSKYELQPSELFLARGEGVSRIGIAELPVDVWPLICGHLNHIEILKLSQTCKWIHLVVTDNIIWKQKCFQEQLPVVDSADSRSLMKLFLDYISLRAKWMTGSYISSNSGEYQKGVKCLAVSRGRVITGSWDGQLTKWKVLEMSIPETERLDPSWFNTDSDGWMTPPPTPRCFNYYNVQTASIVERMGQFGI